MKKIANKTEIILLIQALGGNVLEQSSDKLKNNKEVVSLAVNNDGLTLKYASDELKNNKEVVLQIFDIFLL